MWNNRLAKTNSGNFQLLELFRRQLGIPLGQETDGIVHPLYLFSFSSPDHAALPNCTKQLIPSAIGY